MSIADEMSRHAFITQLVMQIRERVKMTSPKLHLRQVVACLILAGNVKILLFQGAALKAKHEERLIKI